MDEKHINGHAPAAAARRRPQSRSTSSNRQRSGSSTPILDSIRLPSASSSRPSSPSRLRSLPQVGLSNVEALSDAAAARDDGLAAIDVNSDHRHHQRRLCQSDDCAAAAAEEDAGHDKELTLPPPRPAAASKFAEEALIDAGISDYTFIPRDHGGLLGKGKFSSVQLAWKHGVKYAVKVTPLYPHHNLIATRLLREPTILAQLPLHPNLVKVYESIRTPGHFYLVEEYLEGYTNLENFVSSQPESKLTVAQSLHIFHQLVSVVRSALHEPIQIAHRDIKPENILVHPITLRIILLDFGLATHFSSREAKLTTCCGSPAFHAPELVKSLKSPPGSVRYWGPEIDIWTIGVTVLRCISGVKYPLGVQHTSLQHLADKTIDAVLSVKDRDLRKILAGLLDMDGEKRMEYFKSLPEEIDQIPFRTLDSDEKHDYIASTSLLNTISGSSNTAPHTLNGFNRQFKNTTFIETEPKHSLSLILASPPSSATHSGIQDFSTMTTYYEGGGKPITSFLRSRSQSRDRLNMLAPNGVLGLQLHAVDEKLAALNPIPETPAQYTGQSSSVTSPTTLTPSTPELVLLNPNGEPAMRAISYVKYALRCAGILYHIQPPCEDLSQDSPLSSFPKENLCYPILHCVRVVPPKELEKSPAASLLHQLRPPLTRAATMGAAAANGVGRSSSTPPGRSAKKNGKSSDEVIRCLEFWIQIIPVFLSSVEKKGASDKTSETDFASKPRKERAASQKRRPKSRSRDVSSMNHHHHQQHHRHEDSRRCIKLRIRVSDDNVLDVLKKALQGSTADSTDNYAMYATPPPVLRQLPVPLAARKMVTTSSSGEDAETSMEEDRGRPLVSRSRSSETKSRSRSKQRSSTGRRNAGQVTNGHAASVVDKAGTGSEQELTSPEPKNGVLEARLDSEEEARLAAALDSSTQTASNPNAQTNAKRGFFDFVSAFNIKGRPTAAATAPSTPAALPEELEQAPAAGEAAAQKDIPAAAYAPM